MERFIVREPRSSAGLHHGPPPILISDAPNHGNMIPDPHFSNAYGTEYPGSAMLQRQGSGGYIVVEAPRPGMAASHRTMPMHSGSHPMSGIDPGYLARYSSSNAMYITSGYMGEASPAYGPYENRPITGPDRTRITHAPDIASTGCVQQNQQYMRAPVHSTSHFTNKEVETRKSSVEIAENIHVTSKAVPEPNQNEITPIASRGDKLKRLYKSGLRTFSGPVDKVLKWHKALHDVDLLVIYEIVAKLVSVRPGEGCSKHLVIRDESGPAMQVVYYEIDFLLPELKPPCTVRIVGRIMPGTCRLQAFSVRPATGSDVATLSRRAAVADHHVAKLGKEYGKGAI